MGRGRGWHGERARHSAAARGIPTAHQMNHRAPQTSIKPFLFNPYRRELWRNVRSQLRELAKFDLASYGIDPFLDSGIGPRNMIDSIFVFGSFATDKRKPMDIDIVVFRKDLPPSKFDRRWEYTTLDLHIMSNMEKTSVLNGWAIEAQKKYKTPAIVDVTKEVLP